MKLDYSVETLCTLMSLSRSSYYKWRSRKGALNRYQKRRKQLTALLQEKHDQFPSYGYHRLASLARKEIHWHFSDHLVHQCCKEIQIRSKARRPRYVKSGAEHRIYPNRIKSHWNAKGPLEVVVSDMTYLKCRGKTYEWVYLLDTFNNEILSSHLAQRKGDPKPYFRCLLELKDKITKESTATILHTDQGSVYGSRAFAQAHEKTSLIRSMSRAGTPTDNPIIESVNGWIKQEMLLDFDLEKCEQLEKFITDFVHYFNNERPAYALNYKSPVQFKIEQGF
jgi:putative transposase